MRRHEAATSFTVPPPRSGMRIALRCVPEWRASRRIPPLRMYVAERLAGMVVTSTGVPLAGPQVAWKGRRHGRRQARRWARAWSPEQIA